ASAARRRTAGAARPGARARCAQEIVPPAGEVSKPSSVPACAGGDHSSGPAVAVGLERPTRSHRAGHATPVWSCFGWGLPCPACHQAGGALLPHRFTLTCFHRRFTFCCTVLRVTSTGR